MNKMLSFILKSAVVLVKVNSEKRGSSLFVLYLKINAYILQLGTRNLE